MRNSKFEQREGVSLEVDLEKQALIFPRLVRMANQGLEQPQTFYVQDRAGSLPSIENPQREEQAKTPAEQQAEAVRANYVAEREKIWAKYLPQIQTIAADAILGPGVMAKSEGNVKNCERDLDEAIGKCKIPKFNDVGELCKDMRAVLRANGGVPEENPKVLRLFQERINEIMGAEKERDPAFPDGQLTEEYVTSLERSLKIELCFERWSQFDFKKHPELKAGNYATALYDATFGKTLEQKIEVVFPGYRDLNAVVHCNIEYLKAENERDLKLELVAAKGAELRDSWLDPTDSRFIPELKVLFGECKKELSAARDKHDKKLMALGYSVPPPVTFK